jgi:hypothetical protein
MSIIYVIWEFLPATDYAVYIIENLAAMVAYTA